jgi:hypothetical protein
MGQEKPTTDSKLSDIDKAAIDGAIKYQAGLFDLMRHTDTRAQQFIGTYTALAGAAALIASSKWFPDGMGALGKMFFLAYTGLLVVGVYCAFRACGTAVIRLPSRRADFWLWARRNHDLAVSTFLADADKATLECIEIQNVAGRWLDRAMRSGVLAVAAAALSVMSVLAGK